MSIQRSRAKEAHRSLFRTPKRVATLLAQARKMLGSHDLKILASLIAPRTNRFHKYVSTEPFPKTYALMRRETYIPFSPDLTTQIRWECAVLASYSTELNSYIEHRFLFENSVLQGDYVRAGETLEAVRTKLGCSLWLVEKEFLLRELRDGLSANTSLLTELSETPDIANIIPLLAGNLSMRVERNVSSDTYRTKIDKLLAGLEDRTGHPEFCRYLRMYWDPCSKQKVGDLAKTLLLYEVSSPIIDRYNTLAHICTRLAAENHELCDDISAEVARLQSAIPDMRLSLVAARNGNRSYINSSALSKEFLTLFDQYAVGDYECSGTTSLQLIERYPSVLEPYEIYLKSLGRLNRVPEFTTMSKNLSSVILRSFHHILVRDDQFRNSIDALSKISLMMGDSPIAHQLAQTISKYSTEHTDQYSEKVASINSDYANPRSTLLDDGFEAAVQYLNLFEEIAPASDTVLVEKALAGIKAGHSQVLLPSSIPRSERNLYEAQAHLGAGNPLAAIPLLEEIVAESSDLPLFVFRDRTVRLLANAYLTNGQLGECAEIALAAYETDPHFALTLPVVGLCNRIGVRRSNSLSINIDIPLLFSHFYKDVRMVYSAYDNFLRAHGFDRPSMLISVCESFPREKLHAFLWKVCTQKVLARSHYLTGTAAMESERMRLCRFLSESDPAQRKVYVEEINQITQRSIIRKGIQQIDESKIYVDESGIRNTGDEFFREAFQRLADFRYIASVQMLRIPNSDHVLVIAPTEGSDEFTARLTERGFEVENVNLSGDPIEQMFCDIFLEIRDRFIWSREYGLNSYLSVRIRHGTLHGQIRSPFESTHLISQKDSPNGEYLPNPYWQSLNSVPEVVQERIEKLLANFSETVDSLTAKLKEEVIQVRTEQRGTTGFFDYSYDAETLNKIYHQRFASISDYDSFMDGIFHVLWDRTHENLKAIRETIETEISNALYESLDQLHNAIRSLVRLEDAASLLSAIKTCQTDVQNECSRVGRWFNVSHLRSVESFQLADILRVSVASINNLYPNRQIHPDINTDSPERYDGKYLTQFVDVFRTLLENAIIHSGLSSYETKTTISTRTTEGQLEIRIWNQLSESRLAADPVKIIERQWGSAKALTDDTVTREGGSGLKKVRKTLTVDLQQNDVSLTAEIIHGTTLVVQILTNTRGLVI